MKPGVIRRLHRRGVIAAEGIGKVEHMWIKLAQRPTRAGKSQTEYYGSCG